MDLQGRRELNQGFGETLSRAFELVLTPVIMGALGWWLDGRLGTRPLLALVLFAFTISYEFWKLYRRYDADMAAKEAELFRRRKRA